MTTQMLHSVGVANVSHYSSVSGQSAETDTLGDTIQVTEKWSCIQPSPATFSGVSEGKGHPHCNCTHNDIHDEQLYACGIHVAIWSHFQLVQTVSNVNTALSASTHTHTHMALRTLEQPKGHVQVPSWSCS